MVQALLGYVIYNVFTFQRTISRENLQASSLFQKKPSFSVNAYVLWSYARILWIRQLEAISKSAHVSVAPVILAFIITVLHSYSPLDQPGNHLTAAAVIVNRHDPHRSQHRRLNFSQRVFLVSDRIQNVIGQNHRLFPALNPRHAFGSGLFPIIFPREKSEQCIRRRRWWRRYGWIFWL